MKVGASARTITACAWWILSRLLGLSEIILCTFLEPNQLYSKTEMP